MQTTERLQCSNCHQYTVAEEHSFVDPLTGKEFGTTWILSSLAAMLAGLVLTAGVGLLLAALGVHLAPFGIVGLWVLLGGAAFLVIERRRFFGGRIKQVTQRCTTCGARWAAPT